MEISTQFMVLVPIVLGVVEGLKQTGISSKWAPLLSLVLGVLGVYLVEAFTLSGPLIIEGLVVGLSASGLYSGVKKTFTNP
jgi:hypothetical protein